MIYFSFGSQHDANIALSEVNIAYKLPYEGNGGYIVENWDILRELPNNRYGFLKPENFLGKTYDIIIGAITISYIEVEFCP